MVSFKHKCRILMLPPSIFAVGVVLWLTAIGIFFSYLMSAARVPNEPTWFLGLLLVGCAGHGIAVLGVWRWLRATARCHPHTPSPILCVLLAVLLPSFLVAFVTTSGLLIDTAIDAPLISGWLNQLFILTPSLLTDRWYLGGLVQMAALALVVYTELIRPGILPTQSGPLLRSSIRLSQISGGVIAGIGLWLMALMVRRSIPMALQPLSGARPLAAPNDDAGWILAFIVAVIIAPVLEEKFFRGYVLNHWRRRVGPLKAAVASAALFAMAHLKPAMLLPLWLVGLILAWLAYRERTLVTPIIAHATFNAISLIVLSGLLPW